MEEPLRHIHSMILPLHWLKNWLSHLHSRKYLCIRDIFDKKILSHKFFKATLKSKAQNLTVET